MGRMRIKKKEAVLPFRETLAFRMILLTGSFIVFVISLYFLVGAVRTSIPLAVAYGIASIVAVFAIFYNLDHMRDAKIPKQTLNRMKRR
jgi:multidrug transporter EmrE-like cation transporter